MSEKKSSFLVDRREFLSKSLSSGSLLCLGGCNLLTVSQAEIQDTKHKFLEKSDITYKRVFELAIKSYYLPLINSITNEIGKNRLISIIEKDRAQSAEKAGKRFAQNSAKNDVAAFISAFWIPVTKSSFYNHTLTVNVIEQTATKGELKITDCLIATVFREANAPDIGYARSCSADFPMVKAFNPKIKLIRDKSIMNGDDFCHFQYYLEE